MQNALYIIQCMLLLIQKALISRNPSLTHSLHSLQLFRHQKKEIKMEEGNGKRKGGDEGAGYVSGKRSRTPENGDVTGENKQLEQEQGDDDMMAWLTLDEETAAELSKLLDSDEAVPPPFKVRFMNDPYMSPVVFQSSSAYVTINGNEETCGSSFSESESSLMASVDMGEMKRKVFGEVSGWFGEESGGAWGSQPGGARGIGVECSGFDGFLVSEMDVGYDLFDSFDNPNFVDNDADDDTWVKFLGEDLFGSQ